MQSLNQVKHTSIPVLSFVEIFKKTVVVAKLECFGVRWRAVPRSTVRRTQGFLRSIPEVLNLAKHLGRAQGCFGYLHRLQLTMGNLGTTSWNTDCEQNDRVRRCHSFTGMINFVDARLLRISILERYLCKCYRRLSAKSLKMQFRSFSLCPIWVLCFTHAAKTSPGLLPKFAQYSDILLTSTFYLFPTFSIFSIFNRKLSSGTPRS